MKMPFKKSLLRLLALSACCVAALFTTAATHKLELPRETQLYRPGSGVELANAHCLACHSADYVAIQPVMPRAFWQASVKKMREKYGMDVGDPVAEKLVDYLAKAYGNEQGNPPSGVAVQLDALATTQNASAKTALETLDGPALLGRLGCVACHTADRKLVGPAFKAVAAKYRGQPDAAAKIARQVSQGGGGQWGPVPMPPFPHVMPDELRVLTAWILDQK